LFASDTPGDLMERELVASQRYLAEEGRVYWADLVEAEERAGERWLARGKHSAWLTSFVSESLLADTQVIFPGLRTMHDLTDGALDEFCRGLTQLLARLAETGVYSYNLAFFAGHAAREDFWLHARIAPRVYMAPHLWGPDTSALQFMYHEHFMVRSPEEAATALRGAIVL
jgi:galactose-1-phosphate uridylyltransferase